MNREPGTKSGRLVPGMAWPVPGMPGPPIAGTGPGKLRPRPPRAPRDPPPPPPPAPRFCGMGPPIGPTAPGPIPPAINIPGGVIGMPCTSSKASRSNREVQVGPRGGRRAPGGARSSHSLHGPPRTPDRSPACRPWSPAASHTPASGPASVRRSFPPDPQTRPPGPCPAARRREDVALDADRAPYDRF